MNKKTRVFLMVAGGVLVVGVGTGLVASYMGLSAIALGGPGGPPDLKYVPADAGLVAFANLHELMSSELHHQLVARGAARPPHGGDLQAQIGIDPETDIDTVVMCASGAATRPGDRGLVLARGRFDEVKVEHFIRERGGQVSDYKGKRVLQHTGGGDAGGDSALVFMEPGLLAFGSTAIVRQAVDLAAGGRNITSNDDVMGLIRGVDHGNAWAVGRFEVLTRRARLPGNMETRLPPITWFAASGRIDDGIEGLVRADARDDAAAQNLREVIQGFVALGRLQAGGNSALTSVINSLQLRSQGKTVSLEFSIPSTEIAALVAALPRPRPSTPPPPALQ